MRPVGIPMEINCVQLFAEPLLRLYEAKFLQELLLAKREASSPASQFQFPLYKFILRNLSFNG